MKVVKYYANDIEAVMDRSLLEAEGVQCRVLNENMPYAGYYAGGNFDIQLVVADEDFDLACAILAAKVAEEPQQADTDASTADR